MSKKLNIGELLGAQVSNLNTMQVQEIALDLLNENPANLYLQGSIGELAESIVVAGLQQPLVVSPAEDGRYMIQAGHRRYKALLSLQRETAPCVVLDANIDPAIQTLVLHWTNTMARGGAGLKGDSLHRSAHEIEGALLALKQRGVVELPGKLREYVADVLQVSEAALARAKAIDNNLIKTFKAEQAKYGINDSVAYELSQCDENLQKKLYEAYKGKAYYLDAKAVKAHKKAEASGFAPTICPAAEYSTEPCVGTDKRAAAVRRGECPGCCHGCEKADGCDWVCGKVSKKLNAEKSTEEARIERERKAAEFWQSQVGKVYVNVREVLERFGYDSTNLPDGNLRYYLHVLWASNPHSYSALTVSTLSNVAATLGITLQDLLFAPADSLRGQQEDVEDEK